VAVVNVNAGAAAEVEARQPVANHRCRQLLLILLVLNALVDLGTGAFAAVAPHAFYRDVVGVDLLGPYNQHLLTDVGEFYLGYGLLFAWAMRTRSLDLIRTISAVVTLTAVLHFAYHADHLGPFNTEKAALQTGALTVAITLPLLALLASVRPGRGKDARTLE
jgi:hypothetical protein